MSASDPSILMTQDAVQKMHRSPASTGRLLMHHLASEDLYVVKAVDTSSGVREQVSIPTQYRTLAWDGTAHAGQWMRQPAPDLNIYHLDLARRPDYSIPFDDFRRLVDGVQDPGHGVGLLISYDPDLSEEALAVGAQRLAGWMIDRAGVRPIGLYVEPEILGIDQLDGLWPLGQMAEHRVVVVGCGSIGGSAVDALAGYGLGSVDLVDPDRLLWHNLVRHVLGPGSVGRYKVDALKDHLSKRWPRQEVRAHRWDVVTDADRMRVLLPQADLVLCAADGIAPRRVVSHLARRAGIPAILACVLERGAIAEILRLRPTPRFGCLLCQREALAAAGAMDAEADQELAYGTGHVHQPMTAMPADLAFTGILAAKVAVATLLESRHGDHRQRLPDEHAIIGLRPAGDLVAPFDVAEVGAIAWQRLAPPRANCSTCDEP